MMKRKNKKATPEFLGRLVKDERQFHLLVANVGVCKPLYKWSEKEINIGTIVGFLTTIDSKLNLVLSTVHTMWMGGIGGKGWQVSTTPILHVGDKRKVKDLPVSEFKLQPKAISCIFKKV